MQPRFGAVALLALVLLGCDAVATSTAEITPTARPGVATGTAAPAGTAVPGSPAPASPAPPATAEPAAPTPVTTTPPRTNPPPPPPPPASVAKVTVLPATSGKLGSTWLLSLTGFPPGRVTETVTNPNGIPKSAFLTAGADGSASATFQTALSDQPGVGRYIFRFDSGSTSVTTAIDVTKP